MGNFCQPNIEHDFVISVYLAKVTRSTLSTFDKVGRDESDFVARVYLAKVTRSTLSTFDKVGRDESDFVARVYRALLVYVS